MRTANLILTGSPVYLGESFSKRNSKKDSLKKESASGFLGMCTGKNTLKQDINMATFEPRLSAKRMHLEQEYQSKLQLEKIKFEQRQEELRLQLLQEISHESLNKESQESDQVAEEEEVMTPVIEKRLAAPKSKKITIIPIKQVHEPRYVPEEPQYIPESVYEK